ncbi:MAG: SOS response-associated peptidase [Anaerolineales bacterium]|nr:SOS response-associated peptidase [Anaerolineales bacterium]MCX7609567.1 SOS response-associated peptidase [Anaerolineales bacterium]MDW8226937.1 SOS response-associated peptidase [Anaerolineales bacterium]
MCGRFALSLDSAELQSAFPQFSFPTQLRPRYNIAPGQPILVLPNDASQRADFFLWGLVPSWAKDPKIGTRLINARAETLAEKPAFRSAFRYRRCLIFANGFYEWKNQAESGKKIPYFIRLKSGEPFAFAGLWEIWLGADGSEIRSAAIITTEANEVVRPIHERMPVILPRNRYAQWLAPSLQSPLDLRRMLHPYPAQEMEAYPVSSRVNHPSYDQADCLLQA